MTQFTYKGDSFTILDDTLSNSELGEWVGYIRKLAVIDSNGKILLQQDTEKATFKTLADIADSKPDAAYIIPFLNVYTVKDGNTQELIVDVNGGYHKAILNYGQRYYFSIQSENRGNSRRRIYNKYAKLYTVAMRG